MEIDFEQLKEIIDSKNTRLINQMAQRTGISVALKVPLYEISAALGDPEAMEELGFSYETGRYYEIDYIKAREWYEKAAVLGYLPAMANLSMMYINGLGVEQNNDIASFLEERVTKTYQYDMEMIVPKTMSGYYDQQALYLVEELDDLDKINDKRSLFRLASMYEIGRKVEKDINKAIKIYENLVDDNFSYAMLCLASIYENGKGVEVDYKKAKELYEKAANLYNYTAMERLASMYEEGRGVEVDYQKAKKLYEEAGELGNSSSALIKLASMYEQEKGVVRDDVRIIALYKKAIDLGNPDAMLYLRDLYKCYMDGTLDNPVIYNPRFHSPFDIDNLYQMAKEKYQKLADLGNPDAVVKLFKLTYTETKDLYNRALGLGVSASILNADNYNLVDINGTFWNPKKR